MDLSVREEASKLAKKINEQVAKPEEELFDVEDFIVEELPSLPLALIQSENSPT